MEFESEKAGYDFYNSYASELGNSIRKENSHKAKDEKITSCLFVCSKEGYRKPKKDNSAVVKDRAETRTVFPARMSLKLNRGTSKYRITDFVENHNHKLVSREQVHMLPYHRSISESQSIEMDLAFESGIPLRSAFELISKEAGGRESVGFLKTDQKNYLRSKRQKMLAYGEVGCILKHFQDQALENPSFFYAVQLDVEEQITNIFLADVKMIYDYSQLGDVVTFDTTYRINHEIRPFGVFTGFNHHRETVIFGAALMYEETADSFSVLFSTFLKAMSNKHPRTIFTDQDEAMAKAISYEMPNTYHRLCVWHMMKNALKHVNHIFKGEIGVRNALRKFIDDYEEEIEFHVTWDVMLEAYDVRDSTWLRSIFGLRKKWARPYVRYAWSPGMNSTQLSESLNADLKFYLKSDLKLAQFFHHFERFLYDKRYKEAQAEYDLTYRLPKVKV